MKRFLVLTFLCCVSLATLARHTDFDAGIGSDAPFRYMGSISVGYSWVISVNLETVHGLMFTDSNIFIGGQAGISYGLPQGFGSYINVLPRWFFYTKENLDVYCSLGIGWYNQAGPYRGSSQPPSVRSDGKNYAGGLGLMPELGIGFKLKHDKSIDLAVRCQLAFELYDSYTDSRNTFPLPYYPALMIGYRF